MFCQSCGAQNADEARFCNMCGTRIARAGEPGGPVAQATAEPAAAGPAAAAPPAVDGSPSVYRPEVQGSATLQGAPSPYGGGPSLMDVSLASIGVRSNKKGFAIVAVVALLLVGLGAGASYLWRGAAEPPPPQGGAEADDPFVIGTPLPEGSDTPDVDIVSGEVAPDAPTPPDEHAAPASPPSRRTRGSRAPSSMRTTGSRAGGDATSAAAGGGEASNQGASSRAGANHHDSAGGGSTAGGSGTSSMDGSGMGSSGAGSAGSGAGPQASGGSGGGGGSDTQAPAGGGSTGGDTTGGGSAEVPTDVPDERDIGMDMYGARVRFVVRRYYAARARNCFDRATRNNPGVSGTVIVNLTIGASGQVTAGSVARNTTGDSTLGACLAAQVQQWRLPPPPGGELQMQMPFSR